MTMGGMGVEEISAKNTHKKMKTLHQTLNPRVWVDKRPQYSSRVWTPPSHLCIDHDPLKTSFIPPLQHASENHLLHVKKSLSYWIPVTGTDMLTGRRDDFKTNKQTKSVLHVLLNYRMETQSQNIQMHFPVTVIMTIKPLIAFKCKAISTSNFTCKALHFSQSWFLVLFGKYVTCYEHFLLF